MRGCKQSVSFSGAPHRHDSTLPLCRSQNELGVTSARVHVRVCCSHVHPFHLCLCCVHLSSRFSPVPSLALRIGSNDQCDGYQCCPSFGGSLRWHHPGVELAARLTQHGETHQVLTHRKDSQIDSSFLIPWMVPRGPSQLVESFVWLVPFVRIDRLIALS